MSKTKARELISDPRKAKPYRGDPGEWTAGRAWAEALALVTKGYRSVRVEEDGDRLVITAWDRRDG